MPVTSDIFKAHKGQANTFIETGSYMGDGIAAAVDAGFNQIYSIEAYPGRYAHCSGRFANNPKVHVLKGNSADVLHSLLPHINEPILFWLDAHYDAYVPEQDYPEPITETFPLLLELETIKNHPIKTHTLLLDDRRIMIGDSSVWHNTTEDMVIDKIKEINYDYNISFIDSACFPSDIILAKV